MEVSMFRKCIFILYMLISSAYSSKDNIVKKPHIVFILADDLGYNDVGYHHRNHIKTPCFDRLSRSGTTLENYYVQPICSPTRSQLLTGRYQIHTGLQHSVIHPPQPSGIPLDNVLLPEQLKSCGYSTYMVGKWHLGLFKNEYLPWNRGFDNFTGILPGGADHFMYEKQYRGYTGSAMYDSENGPTREHFGKYSTTLYTNKAKELIESHDVTKPMFLYLAYQAPHSPLQAPRHYSKLYKRIKHEDRRTYARMVTYLDGSVCKIVSTLRKRKMWKDTIFVFSTDNGGQTMRGGNNWPLRGGKGSLWEGGIKAIGFVNGGYEIPKHYISKQLFHVSDWMPTFMSAAKCPLLNHTLPLDGLSQWNALIKRERSPRKEILHNIDPLYALEQKKKNAFRKGFDTRVRAAIRKGPWKLITGYPGPSMWIEPQEYKHRVLTRPMKRHKLFRLYNIESDPYELHDVSRSRPDVVNHLMSRLNHYRKTSVPVWYPEPDPLSNPRLRNGFWGPWVDST